jgi:hypothetical protein
MSLVFGQYPTVLWSKLGGIRRAEKEVKLIQLGAIE